MRVVITGPLNRTLAEELMEVVLVLDPILIAPPYRSAPIAYSKYSAERLNKAYVYTSRRSHQSVERSKAGWNKAEHPFVQQGGADGVKQMPVPSQQWLNPSENQFRRWQQSGLSYRLSTTVPSDGVLPTAFPSKEDLSVGSLQN